MKKNMKLMKKGLLSLTCALCLTTPNTSFAHLMAAQHGTLSFIGSNVYIALSLPMSAFKGVDDNGDKHVTIQEFNNHRDLISEKIKENIYLTEDKRKFVVDGLLLEPTTGREEAGNYRHTAGESIKHVTIMGRYALTSSNAKVALNVALFSDDMTTQQYDFVATDKNKKLTHEFEVIPSQPSISVFN
ncbi:hypothetical protein [Psychromonas sp. GE-S-Ul-11]|uniref:hypothetical protein n=1 Tax=Psychromonas sp. GE-S-Ul-11 TaxID=3241170 RepID=UPI00390CA756